MKKRQDLSVDPFGERQQAGGERCYRLLGGHFRFRSQAPQLLRLVDAAYANLPDHPLSESAPEFEVQLLMSTAGRSAARGRRRSEPPQLPMMSGAGLLGAAESDANVVLMSPQGRCALVKVSTSMARSPYHVRYEMIEFAVFTLAARAQKLAALHAACVSVAGAGALLIGPSGAGKSTLALHCLLNGFTFTAEDAVFVEPTSMRATGVANFIHLQPESLRWLPRRDAAALRRSPTIRRRSGVRKLEVDLRGQRFALAPRPQRLTAVVFLSARSAGKRPLLQPLAKDAVRRQLAATQPYAAAQPRWRDFLRSATRLQAFVLRRGAHPGESVAALRSILCTSP